jgi:hypothetical protein
MPHYIPGKPGSSRPLKLYSRKQATPYWLLWIWQYKIVAGTTPVGSTHQAPREQGRMCWGTACTARTAGDSEPARRLPIRLHCPGLPIQKKDEGKYEHMVNIQLRGIFPVRCVVEQGLPIKTRTSRKMNARWTSNLRGMFPFIR